MVPLDANDTRVVSHQRNESSRIWSTINHIAQTDDSIFIAQIESMKQSPERRKVSMNIPYSKHAMACFEAGL
jgi:hypothetical protein